jgi:hypothetical protein
LEKRLQAAADRQLAKQAKRVWESTMQADWKTAEQLRADMKSGAGLNLGQLVVDL